MLSSCLGLGKGGRVCVRGWLFSLPWTESSTHDSGGDWGWKALTQRNATLSSRGLYTITQHILTVYWNVQEAGWSGRNRGGGWGGHTSKLIPLCNGNSLCVGQQHSSSFLSFLGSVEIGTLQCVMISCAYEGYLVSGGRILAGCILQMHKQVWASVSSEEDASSKTKAWQKCTE